VKILAVKYGAVSKTEDLGREILGSLGIGRVGIGTDDEGKQNPK
jgi:hypothetical protein